MDSYAVTHKLRQISKNEQFKSVFITEHTSQAPDKGSSPFLSMNNISINQRDVYRLLSKLQPHKATEPDSISERFLKELATRSIHQLWLFSSKYLLTVDVYHRTWKWPTLSPTLGKETRVQQTTLVQYPSRRFAPRSCNIFSILTSWTTLKETSSLDQHIINFVVNAHARLNLFPQYNLASSLPNGNYINHFIGLCKSIR